MPTATTLERRILAIGHEIFARARRAEPSPLRQAWWQQHMLDWIMRDNVLKTQLFRFIEALPKLRGSTAIASHLRQYVRGGPRNGHALPGIVDLATAYASDRSLHARLMAGLASVGSLQMAGAFIAGQTADEAIASVVRLRRANMTFTLDVLGETVLCSADADQFAQVYLDLIDAMAAAAPGWAANPLLDDAPFGPLPRVNLSIKLSALSPKFDAIATERVSAIVIDRLRPVLRRARQRGAFINVDLEHFAVRDLTFDIFRRVFMEPEFRDWENVGVVVQAYLRDSGDDLTMLREWVRRRGTPITVRLVKGAYWDHETILAIANRWPIPVWTEKGQSDEQYERLSRVLLEDHRWTRPAFASHNVRSVAAVLAMAEDLRVPPRTLEVQMLYGMGEPLKQALIGIGQRVRVYTPFGDLMPGMAYFMRRLLENTANESFLRQSSSEHLPEHILLAAPGESVAEAPAPQNAAGRAHPPRHGTNLPRWEASGPDGELDMTPFLNEPLTDFATTAAREALATALREAAGAPEARCPALIGGAAAAGDTWRTLVDPSHPKRIVARIAVCGPSSADRAVQAAAAAQAGWAALGAARRAELLSNAAARLRSHRTQLTAMLIHDLGRTWRDADAEFAGGVDALEFHARAMVHLESSPRRRHVPGETNETHWRPRGPTAVVTPLAMPFAGALGLVSAALAAGNAVIWRPDARAAHVAWEAARILLDAGVPAGAIGVIFGDDDLADALASHSGIATVACAGPRDLVSRIAGLASRSAVAACKRIVAHVIGMSAVIVDDDTDVDEAVLGTLASAFTFAGQGGAAVSRVLVVGDAYGPFVARLTAAAKEMSVGPADDPATSMGPVIDAAAQAAAAAAWQSLRKRGKPAVERNVMVRPAPTPAARTEAATAGRSGAASAAQSAGDEPTLFGPAVLVDVAADAPVPAGLAAPILCVSGVPALSDALELVNSWSDAAAVAFFSRGPEHISRARRELRAAALFINRRTAAGIADRQPFGGLAPASSARPTGSADLLREFLDMVTISENVLRHGLTEAEAENA